MPFALSTSWNSARYSDGEKLIFEIKEIGFEQVELGFSLTSSMVKDIQRLAREKLIGITSVHNYCPIPDDLERQIALPDYYSLASRDEKERQNAVKFTKKSIETAKLLGAKAVVLHTGRVEIPDQTRELINLYVKGLKGTEAFNSLRDKLIRQRRQAAKPHLENALKSLDELNRFARSEEIFLGLENRFYYREIPNFEEIGIILKSFKGGNILYWHDTGHAQVMENLGITTHKDFLDLYGNNLLGLHLHNVSGCSDHKPPSKGDLDFKFLKPYVKENTIKVIEAHYPATAEEIRESKSLLETVLNGKF